MLPGHICDCGAKAYRQLRGGVLVVMSGPGAGRCWPGRRLQGGIFGKAGVAE